MRVLVLFAHPCEDSYGAALHRRVVETLRARGDEVDDCDLYAEGFQPILSAQERRGYHDLSHNRESVAGYVDRLQRAEALVIVCPIWNFGFPAILKGYFDRVFLPGVSFRMVEGRTQAALDNISRLAAVTTYGSARFNAWLVGDPPRRIVTRVLRGAAGRLARLRYLAHYDMNRSTLASRAAFLDRIAREMRSF
ncbi:NAD(P)H-dependent oxidoreductase [Labrys wisconsinensis]|uniref:NADPH-quinone reductase n=1 Tax=Labrys wisconsinensis TaxID=425677 RepID=A0ABU0JCA1_9HYPH|nr:NAD(P)H-dependent oxidoreductase [Labrys wisconsinensis]MDQ0471121.1 putative NADPH-quinone reductase [Labrys wisconsinensis]